MRLFKSDIALSFQKKARGRCSHNLVVLVNVERVAVAPAKLSEIVSLDDLSLSIQFE